MLYTLVLPSLNRFCCFSKSTQFVSDVGEITQESEFSTLVLPSIKPKPLFLIIFMVPPFLRILMICSLPWPTGEVII